MQKTKSLWCPTCNEQRAFVARRPSGCLHTVLTFVTLGLWLVIWPVLYARSGTLYHCPVCGGRRGKRQVA